MESPFDMDKRNFDVVTVSENQSYTINRLIVFQENVVFGVISNLALIVGLQIAIWKERKEHAILYQDMLCIALKSPVCGCPICILWVGGPGRIWAQSG